MPITSPLKLRNLTKTEFDERDAVVMRCAYAAQNALGRLCDERVYENDLAHRLRAEGFKSVHTQVPVMVAHEGFNKEYRIDLVADDALYELKTVSGFAPPHDTQALHYAMLMDVSQVKLLNFRTGMVQGRLLVNAFLNAKRYNLLWDERGWQPLSPQCDALSHRLRAVLDEWGACLEVRLYEDVLVHSCGGEAVCVRRVPVLLDGIELGSQAIQSHGPGLCFVATAFTSEIDAQCGHLRRLLRLTGLRAIQWLNFNHTTVQLHTIQT